jgi:insulysin
VAYVTPQQTVLTYLVCELVTDSLTEWSYDASIAGLVYKINSAATGFQIAVTGYNDKIARLLQTVVETLAGLKPNPERLSVLTRQLEQDLDNFKMEQPYTISDHWCRSVLQLNTWTKDQLLSTIRCKSATRLHFAL